MPIIPHPAPALVADAPTMRERLIRRVEGLRGLGASNEGFATTVRCLDDEGAAKVVDAILAELREPDEEMSEAGWNAHGETPERFTAMIDAIREPKP